MALVVTTSILCRYTCNDLCWVFVHWFWYSGQRILVYYLRVGVHWCCHKVFSSIVKLDTNMSLNIIRYNLYPTYDCKTSWKHCGRQRYVLFFWNTISQRTFKMLYNVRRVTAYLVMFSIIYNSFLFFLFFGRISVEYININ